MDGTHRVGMGTRWIVITLVVLTLGVPLTAASPIASQEAPPIAQVGSDVDPDNVLMAVALHRDGSATWRVEYRVRLDSDNVTRAFESLQTDIQGDPEAFAGPFADRMAGTATAAENATGRTMAIRNVTVAAERRQLPQDYGVVVYRFDWVGFAALDGDRIRAGSAVAGLFLDPETTLLVSWPTGYDLVEVTPEPDDRRATAVSWTGRLDFAAGEPLLVLAPTEATGTDGSQTTDSETGPGDGAGEGAGPAGGLDTVLIVVGVVVFVAISAGGWWVFERRNGDSRTEAVDTSEADDDPQAPPDELLSNQERVLSLLQDQGGRMKQQEVAQALQWTDAKTSQVVGDLRETGKIESFRLGRENVLSLPEESGSDVAEARDEDDT